MTPDPAEVERVVAKLTPAQKRACLAMTDQPQLPGRATFTARGAWGLYWGRSEREGRLCHYEAGPSRGSDRRYTYRLTTFGLAVRARLQELAR